MNVVGRIVRIKLLGMLHKVVMSWQCVVAMCKFRHIHFYRTIGKQGINIYKECRCGSRKVLFTARGFIPVDVEWLVGSKGEL